MPTTASFSETVVFLLLGAIAVGMALFTITRRNPVTATMSLVGTFVALAGIYATLSAHFLAIMQISVYAGAIMVLFIFVVMILNRDEASPVGLRGLLSRSIGVISVLLLFAFLTVIAVRASKTPLLLAPVGDAPADFGTVASIGKKLFIDFVFPFEAISVLLLVAIVGGLVVSRSVRQEHRAEEVAERGKAIRALVQDEVIQGAVSENGTKDGTADVHGHGAPTAAGGHH